MTPAVFDAWYAELGKTAGASAIADAFLRSRLGDGRDRNYGTLPDGVDTEVLLRRADPWKH